MFGAVHSSVAQRVLSGRHRSPQLSVRADVVDRRLPVLVLGYLVVLGLVTIVLAVLIDADGAGHPVTIASVVVALAGHVAALREVLAAADRQVEPGQAEDDRLEGGGIFDGEPGSGPAVQHQLAAPVDLCDGPVDLPARGRRLCVGGAIQQGVPKPTRTAKRSPDRSHWRTRAR